MLPGTRSVVVLDTVATFVIPPSVSGFTVTVNVYEVDDPAANVPMKLVGFCALVTVPGYVSTTVTFCARLGPAFVTTIV